MAIQPPFWFWLIWWVFVEALILIEAERPPVDPYQFHKRNWYGWQ